jgi:non-heme chloroperoxidase
LKLISIVKASSLVAAITVGIFSAAIYFGGPKPPPPMVGISNPFKNIDFSDLPALQRFTAKDGAKLAYRYYSPTRNASGSVVLVHGSSSSSYSMHVLARAFATGGFAVYALDMRGHGASGPKGKINYIGQLEDDLDSFVHAVSLPHPSTLVGFSAGGGFALRFAGSARQDAFQSYLFLSPYLSPGAPNYRRGSGGWVSVGIPRIIAISFINRLGIHACNDMPVVSFALGDEAKAFMTPEYSFALAANFQPQRDYEKDIKSAHQPCAVLAGEADEIFLTDKLLTIFRKAGKEWPVILLPGVDHIGLTLAPTAVNAAVEAVQNLQSKGS